jgi:phage protein D
MIREIVHVLVDGKVQEDFVADLTRLEVLEDVEAADVFRLQLHIVPQRDGSWRYLEDGRFGLWSRLAVAAGYGSDPELLFDGYVTHREVRLGAPEEESLLEVTGMDASALMDLEEKTIAWPDRSDTEIASTIFESYGLSYEVQETGNRRETNVVTTMQRESDIRFLRRLAARNGFECYVSGGKGYFRTASLERPPQKTLAYGFGDETNVAELRFRIDGHHASRAEGKRVDPFEKRVEEEVLEDSGRRSLGARRLADVQPGGHRASRLLKHESAATTAELRARARAAREPAERFVRLAGTIDSRLYGAVLRAKKLVTVKGAGASLSGLYYVTRVHHAFTVDEYTQRFEAVRNGLGLTGEESFEAASLPFALTAGADAASRGTGNRVLPALQTGSVLPVPS